MEANRDDTKENLCEGKTFYTTKEEVDGLLKQDSDYDLGKFSNACFKPDIIFFPYPKIKPVPTPVFYGQPQRKIATFMGSVFYGNINFIGSIFDTQVRFDDAIFLGDVNFTDAVFWEKVTFGRTQFRGKVIFGNTKFAKLADFYSAQFEQDIDFEKTRFEETVVFSEAYFKNDVKFSYATLGDMIFRQAEFAKGFDLAEVANPNKWNGNFFDIPRTFKVKKNDNIPFKNQRETFRIIKDQLMKQNNNIDALYFRSLEMEAYNMELNEPENDNKYILEKILLGINQSNSYGLNYLKPAAILLAFNLIFTKLLIIVQYQCTFVSTKFCSIYWQLLDPAIKPSDLYEKEASLSWETYAVFFISRLFLAYLIFQTISAFRKHSK